MKYIIGNLKSDPNNIIFYVHDSLATYRAGPASLLPSASPSVRASATGAKTPSPSGGAESRRHDPGGSPRTSSTTERRSGASAASSCSADSAATAAAAAAAAAEAAEAEVACAAARAATWACVGDATEQETVSQGQRGKE